MKFVKMLGLLAVAAAAMMAFAGIASADVATSPAGTAYTGKIVAKNGKNAHVSLHGSNGVTIECSSSVEGNLTGHGAGAPVTGSITNLSFSGCTNGNTVHVTANGTLTAHATSGGNATLTSSGTKVEVTASSIFGTITCIYATNNTSIGTVTGGEPASLDINATIPRTGGSSLCGNSGVWTGSYEVTSPKSLTFDKT